MRNQESIVDYTTIFNSFNLGFYCNTARYSNNKPLFVKGNFKFTFISLIQHNFL